MAKGFMTRRSGNPQPIVYEENMIQFFSIPGASGKIRLKVENPADADGVMIRWKSSVWVAGDTKDTGTLVATITDDSNYKDANQWYEVPGLTDGTVYYFKAFPYKGSAYNEMIGVNETLCKAGGLFLEYTGDSVSGSTVNDTSGNSRNGTMSNVISSTHKIGNGLQSNSSSAVISLPSMSGLASTNFSICFFFKQTTLTTSGRNLSLALNGTGGYTSFDGRSTGLNYLVKGAGGNDVTTYTSGESVFIELRADGQANLNVNLQNKHTASYNTSNNLTPVVERLLADRYDGYSSPTANIDQFRIYSRALESYELANLYNGGAGC